MHIVTMGELLIDMFPGKIGQCMGEVETFHPKPGGAPANVAVAASRLGADCAFIGKVGDDLFGHYLARVLSDEGVETRGIRYDDEARTTLAIIAMPNENSAEFVFYRNPGADQRLHTEDLDLELISRAKVFHFGSVSLSDEPARSATHAAVKHAQQMGVFISYDVNYRPSLWKDSSAALEQANLMLPYVNLLKVNEEEVALLSGTEIQEEPEITDLKCAARKLIRDNLIVVVTLGPRGSLFVTKTGSGYRPGYSVETIDAVGCGDTFIAALLWQIVQQEEKAHQFDSHTLSSALQFANAAGAITSTRRGVIPALPTAQEVKQFLTDNA